MKHRHTLGLFFISLPICVLLRSIQLCFTIDHTTGFAKQHYSELSTVISFVIYAAIATVSIVALSIDNIKAKEQALNPALAISSLLASGMFVYDTVTCAPVVGLAGWYHVVLVILGVFSAIAFGAYGLKNIYPYDVPSAMFLIPVFYYIIKLINVFVSTSSLSLVTENVFLIFTNGAILLFLFEFAKFKNGISETESAVKRLVATGTAAIMLCVTFVVPKFIVLVTNKIKPYPHDISAMLLILSVGIFIFVFLLSNLKSEKEKSRVVTAKHLAE